MKTFTQFALFIFLFSLTAKADPVNVTCTTDPLTTSVAIFTTGTDVTVRVINHNGVDYIPLSQTIITPHDLSGLAQKAKVLQKLGTQYDIHVSSSNCTVSPQKLISCYGTVAQTINGEKLTYFSLDTSTVTTLSTFSPDPTIQTLANLSLTLDGADYDFAMNYDSSQCIDTSSRSLK